MTFGVTEGQQAMITAKVWAMGHPEADNKGGRGQKVYSENTVSRDLASKARTVLKWAPELVAHHL